MDESGIESTAELHFFYEERRETGDSVGIVDAVGNLVVEYRYDAWGKPISAAGSKADTLGKLNAVMFVGCGGRHEEERAKLYTRGIFADLFNSIARCIRNECGVLILHIHRVYNHRLIKCTGFICGDRGWADVPATFLYSLFWIAWSFFYCKKFKWSKTADRWLSRHIIQGFIHFRANCQCFAL